MTGLRFDHYDWDGGSEAMLRFGPDTGPVAIVALPLFEEANRTRQFAVAICRALAGNGVGAVLPDFPGTGESLVETSAATISRIRDAYRALANRLGETREVHGVGIRSGALFDTDALLCRRWHLAPQTGNDVLRDLWRVRQAGSDRPSRFAVDRMLYEADTSYAGNLLSQAMLAELSVTEACGGKPGMALRTVRLDTDPRPADVRFPGTPLWRRAEPDSDDTLAQRLADDIAEWMASCAH